MDTTPGMLVCCYEVIGRTKDRRPFADLPTCLVNANNKHLACKACLAGPKMNGVGSVDFSSHPQVFAGTVPTSLEYYPSNKEVNSFRLSAQSNLLQRNAYYLSSEQAFTRCFLRDRLERAGPLDHLQQQHQVFKPDSNPKAL